MSCSSCGYSTCQCSSSCTTYVCAGCPIQLDTACSFYHKDNAEVSALPNLNISNGATLELVLESIDPYIGQIKVSNFSLPFLRIGYVVNTMQQFAQAVDTVLSSLNTSVNTALGASQTLLVANDSATIDFTTSGALNHTLTGSVKLSGIAGNRMTGQTDGLYVGPQSLSVNYSTKELTLSDGNTVSMAGLLTGASGFLGNLTSDPSAVDGQYYFNTSSSLLRIKVNSIWKTITTS